MSILEEILKDTQEAKKMLEEQTKETLKNVSKDVVAQIIKESITTEGDEDDFEDDSDDTMDIDQTDGTESTGDSGMLDTGDTVMPTDDTIDTVDTDDAVDTVDTGNTDDFSTDAPTDDLDDMNGEMTDHDLSDLSTDELFSEIERMIASGEIDENTPIVIKKDKPSFSVEVQNDEFNDGTENVDMDMDLEEEGTDYDSMYENKEITALKELVDLYEAKLEAEQTKHKKLVTENKDLKNQIKSYSTILGETKEFITSALLTNTNLAHVVKLFNNNSFSKNEKVSIVERFDKVKTIGESKILFETLCNPITNNKNDNKLSESVKKGITENKKVKIVEEVVLYEEKTYVDPVLAMMKKMK